MKNRENPGLAELQLNQAIEIQNQGKKFKFINAKDNNLLHCGTNLRKTRSSKNLGEFDSVNKSMNNVTNSFIIKKSDAISKVFLQKKQHLIKNIYFF